VITLSIAAAVLLAAFLCRRDGRIPRIESSEMARLRLASDKERREWIHPFGG
jgi:hypothetical protein